MGKNKDVKLEQLIFGMLHRIQREQLLSERVAQRSSDTIALHEAVKHKIRRYSEESFPLNQKIQQAIVDEILLELHDENRQDIGRFRGTSDRLTDSFPFDPSVEKISRSTMWQMLRRFLMTGAVGFSFLIFITLVAITFRVWHDDIPVECVGRELINRHLIDYDKCAKAADDVQTTSVKKSNKRKKQ